MSDKTTDPDSRCLALNGAPARPLPTPILKLGIGFGWVVFGAGCCALISLALWLRMTDSDAERRIRRLRRAVSRLCHWYLGYNMRVRVLTVSYNNARVLGPGLIIANHPTLVDALWILATQQEVCCVLKGDLRRSALLSYLVRALDYVSNHDPEQLLAEGTRRLQAGETLLVFPEATRTEPGALPQFKLGAAELLVRSGATAYPVVIHKDGPYLSKDLAWYQFPEEPMHWHIEFAPPMQPQVDDKPRQARRQITLALERYFHQRLS